MGETYGSSLPLQVPMANTPSYTPIADGMIAELGLMDLDGGSTTHHPEGPTTPPPRHRKSAPPTRRKHPNPPSLPRGPTFPAGVMARGEGGRQTEFQRKSQSHPYPSPPMHHQSFPVLLKGGRVLWCVGVVKEPGYISQIWTSQHFV